MMSVDVANFEESMREDFSHMPFHTRVFLARELVSCARMIVAMPQKKTIRISKNIVAIDDYTDSELSQVLMYQTQAPKEKYSGWEYCRLKQKILDSDTDLKSMLGKFGITDVANREYEIHHMDTKKPHRIESGHSKEYYEELYAELELDDSDIKEEIKNIVIIPGWLHRLCTAQEYNYKNRQAYYDKWREILLSLRKSKEDEKANGKKKSRKELQCEVRCLSFNDKNIATALNSIRNLSLSIGEDDKTEIIDWLKNCYIYLRDKIIDMLESNS